MNPDGTCGLTGTGSYTARVTGQITGGATASIRVEREISGDPGIVVLDPSNTHDLPILVGQFGVLRIENAAGLGTPARITTVLTDCVLELADGVTIPDETLSGSGIGATKMRSVSGVNTWAGPISNAQAVEFDVVADRLILATPVSRPGSSWYMTKMGPGTLQYTATETSGLLYSASVTEGTLQVDGVLDNQLYVMSAGRLTGTGILDDIEVDGVVAPGNSIGTLTVRGDIGDGVYFQSSATFEVEIGGDQADQLVVGPSGTVDLNLCTLSLSIISQPTADTYKIIDAPYGQVSGQFGNVGQKQEIDGFTIDYHPLEGGVILTRLVGTGVRGGPPPKGRLHSWPNPSSHHCNVIYELDRTGRVSLGVFDVRGKRVRSLLVNSLQSPGERQIRWDGRSDTGTLVPSGVYWLRLNAGGQTLAVKQVRIR